MNGSAGLDWVGFFHSLSDDEVLDLAAWLTAEGLEVGEFMEVVDRAYARTLEEWRGQSPVFMAWFGRPAAMRYARRKRRFSELMTAQEEARMSGALPGDVALDELKPLQPPWTTSPSAEKVLGALMCAQRDAE
ncbi:MAG TPA: hypothetical protein VFQ25_13540 [Ktedonobacterales bacterium]|nr:hypothetical protein [Ktedonobacterales bacterium]